MADKQPDFGGYATKAGLRCSDGRVIQAQAFQHMDGVKVPLVWMHGHKEPENILGHAILESRSDGVYAHGFLNSTSNATHAKLALQHGDLDSLSIYANQLREQNKIVSHGSIKEVSLVLSGANPGAKIDHVSIQHSDDPDDVTELEDEAIIKHMGPVELPVADAKVEDDTVEHADGAPDTEDGETVQDVWDTLNEKQLNVVNFVIGTALENQGAGDNSAEHSDTDEGLAHQEGTDNMPRNVFENNGTAGDAQSGATATISHSDMLAIFADGKKRGSFKEAVNSYVADHDMLQHGITNIEVLFPDAKAIANTPEFDKRRTEWVAGVLDGTHHTPFAKIKTLTADITQDAARAKGYIKGNYKIEEWLGVTKRTTGPTTVYKKQKLDRDDILDISDFNVVAWLMGEMRMMLEEEIARAILIGDGRAPEDLDKIKDPLGASDGTGIRSILNEHELYATTLYVNVADAASDYEEVVDAVMDGMEFYKGTGTPTYYTTVKALNKFKKAKDANGQRYYKNNAEVAEALGVDRIVTVEPMNEVVGLIGIIVNLTDYNVGTNAGGEITSFEDFDIDYNQEKYLLETRLSGALIKIKSALIIRETAAANVLVVPPKPSFNRATGVVTIPTVTGVVYKDGNGTTLTAGTQTAMAPGVTVTTYSQPAAGYYFADTASDSWPFTRDRA